MVTLPYNRAVHPPSGSPLVAVSPTELLLQATTPPALHHVPPTLTNYWKQEPPNVTPNVAALTHRVGTTPPETYTHVATIQGIELSHPRDRRDPRTDTRTPVERATSVVS